MKYYILQKRVDEWENVFVTDDFAYAEKMLLFFPELLLRIQEIEVLGAWTHNENQSKK